MLSELFSKLHTLQSINKKLQTACNYRRFKNVESSSSRLHEDANFKT